MAYVITGSCIDSMDRSCLAVCPVECIHEAARMLVIDPDNCIDCGACEPECPVGAIYAEEELPAESRAFAAINTAVRRGIDAVSEELERHLAASGRPPER